MDIISRKEAKEKGLIRYFTGEPCKHRHVVERFVITRACVECHKKSARKWQKDNPEKKKEGEKKWQQNNPNKVNAREAKRRASKLQRTPAWADLEKIKSYYTLAKYFEFITLGIKYHVDHIVPLQGKNVCGLHVPDNLQVLRFDHNCSKNNQWNWETQSHE
jgi:hypothetical protein